MYFFNLSACQNLTGYLYDFRLEPFGVSSGKIEIDAVSFEREAALYDDHIDKHVTTTDDGVNRRLLWCKQLN